MDGRVEVVGGVNQGKLVSESALTANEWAYLCGFLQMDLQQILKLTNQELLQATNAEIARRQKRTLTSRVLGRKSSA